MASPLESSYPLSPMQQGMVYSLFTEPGSGIDVFQIFGTLDYRLDIAAFRGAWQWIVDRHAVLRTTFRWEGLEEPRQEVWREVRAVVECVDWRRLSAEEQAVRLEAYLVSDRKRRLDPTRAPLWRMVVFDAGPSGAHFVWTFPHALLDGRSVSVLIPELFEAYEAVRRQEKPRFPPTRPYREFLEWLGRQDRSGAEGYWRKRLSGFTSPTLLGIGKPRGRRTGTTAGTKSVQMGRGFVYRLRERSQTLGLTVNSYVQTAWAALLGRYSGEEDVVFGVTRAGRASTLEGADSMVGLFLNTVPIRARIPAQATVLEVLKSMRAEQIAVREHEHTPLVDIQRWSEVPQGTPLFESLVVFSPATFDATFKKLGAAWACRTIRPHARPAYPIALYAYEEPELLLKIYYDEDRFEDAAIERMLGHLGTLLEAMAEEVEAKIGDLPVLTKAECDRILVEWNATGRKYPAAATVHGSFEAQAAQTPDTAAVVFGNDRLTYRELDARANQVARLLRRLDVGPNVLVGVCMDRSVDMVVGLLGVLKAGGAYVPLDPAYPEERLAFTVDDAQPRVVLTQATLASRLPARVRLVRLDTEWGVIASEDPDHPGHTATSETLAYVMYTSGSTGRPKGVMIRHRNVVNFFAGIDDVVDAAEPGVWLAVTSISFDISVLELFWTLARGFTVVLQEEWKAGPSTAELIRKHRVTHMQSTPSLARSLTQDPDARQALRSLRALLLGGEALPPELLAELGEAPSRAIHNMYGPTETTIWSTAARVDGIRGAVPIGRPLANTQVYVLDRYRRPVAVGIPGELFIGGDGVAAGYLGQPELTDERFVADTFHEETGRRLYRTGDLVRWFEDGSLDFLGRLDEQVKIRGHRVELGEIEARLKSHSGVKDAVVAARDYGPAGKRLLAYVIPANRQAPAADALRQFLGEMLPEHMIPAAFVGLKAFPLTPNGKIDRKALPAADGERAELATAGKPFVAPRNDVERKLAAIWERLLGVAPIGVHDGFFELGGHSLLVNRLFLAIRDAFGASPPLHTLFERPTVEDLAALIACGGAVGNNWAWLRRLKPDGSRPPFFAVHVGESYSYDRLAGHLADDQPLLVMMSRAGLDGSVAPYYPCTSVEDMAGRYLERLRAFQPTGPYFLGGFCMGGLVAYEMARRLLAEGEPVPVLCLIDVFPFTLQDENLGSSASARLGGHLGQLGQLSFMGGVKYVWTRLRATMKWRHVIVRIAARGAKVEAACSVLRILRWPLPSELLLARVRAIASRMMHAYSARSYPGRVTLFVSSSVTSERRQVWMRLAQGGLDMHEIPCAHDAILSEPAVGQIAEKLNAVLLVARQPLLRPSVANDFSTRAELKIVRA